MNIYELKERLQEIADRVKQHGDGSTDTEQDHIDADEALMAYFDGVDRSVRGLFESIKRWYA